MMSSVTSGGNCLQNSEVATQEPQGQRYTFMFDSNQWLTPCSFNIISHQGIKQLASHQ